MTAIDYIRLSLENSKGWTMGLINDMKDAPLTQPTPNGGNLRCGYLVTLSEPKVIFSTASSLESRIGFRTLNSFRWEIRRPPIQTNILRWMN